MSICLCVGFRVRDGTGLGALVVWFGALAVERLSAVDLLEAGMSKFGRKLNLTGKEAMYSEQHQFMLRRKMSTRFKGKKRTNQCVTVL